MAKVPAKTVVQPVQIRPKDDSKRVTLTTGPGKTEQSHKKQCDINYILRDYSKTGIIRHSHQNAGRYDDVSSIDFQSAQNLVADVKSMFETLPSLVRKEFDHDAGKFLEFARNPENGVKMQEMGITPGIDGIDAQGMKIQGMDELLAAIKPSPLSSEDNVVDVPEGGGGEK